MITHALRLSVLAAALALAGHAVAQDYPKLKSGQWDVTINTGKAASAPPTKSTMCIDDALQREMTSMGSGWSREMCTKNEMKRDGARFVGNAECKIGESRIVSHSIMTLTGDTAYHTEVNATFEPPFMGMKDSKTSVDGKYVGPCKDGLVPGDFIGPNGQKFNVKSMASAKPPAMPSSQPPRPAKAP